MKEKKWLGVLMLLTLASCGGTPPTSTSSGPVPSSSSSQSTEHISSSAPSSSPGQTSSSESPSSEAVPSSSEVEEGAIREVVGGTIDQDSKKIRMTVDKDTKTVSLANKVTVGQKAIWRLYRDALGQVEIPTKICASASGELLNGENVFYIVVTSREGELLSIYELDLYRSFLVELSYYNNGRLFATEQVPTGFEWQLIREPNIPGYVFHGWLQNEAVVTTVTPYSDTRVDAKSTAKTYTVSLDPAGGEVETKGIEATYDASYSLPVPTKGYYQFSGWYSDDGRLFGNDGVWETDADIALTARWSACEYRITYVLNGGANSANNPSTYTVEDEITLEDPTSDAYVFDGWTLSDGTAINKIEKGSHGDLTLVANWTLVIPKGTESIGQKAYEYGRFSSVVIPDTVTSIGDYAFSGCASLASITIPSDVTFIGNHAFSGCASLTSIQVDPNNTKYDSREDCNAVIVTEINELILGCAGTVIPEGVASIGISAFFGCASLTSIAIAASVTYIDRCAFYGCASLTSITIPGSVTTIGDGVFSGCSALASIAIPDSVTSIGRRVFFGCASLTSIQVDPNNTKYDSRGGCNAIVETASNKLIAGCAATIIPDSVVSIGVGAFYGCASLTSIAIPASVTRIDSCAFYGCASLTSIVIPNSVTYIGSCAFCGCTSLTIYCEARAFPSGWDPTWDLMCSVVWGWRPESSQTRQ